MATIETLKIELELYKKNLEKIENMLMTDRTNRCAVAEKYLEGINRVLESQTELRALIQRNDDRLDDLDDKVLIINTYVENNKELQLYDFVYSTKKTISMLVAIAYVYGASLSALLFQLIAEFLKMGKG